MPKNDPEYQREYMRKRRQQRQEGQEPNHIHNWRNDGYNNLSCECGEERTRKPGELVSPYTDGLPDWPQLVRQMDGKQIRDILEHPAIKTKK